MEGLHLAGSAAATRRAVQRGRGDAASPLVLDPAVVGAVISPIWYGWLGYHLLTDRT